MWFAGVGVVGWRLVAVAVVAAAVVVAAAAVAVAAAVVVADFAAVAVADFAAVAVAALWLPFSPMLFPDFFSCDPSAPPSMWFSYSLVGWVVVEWVQRQVWARHVDERQHVTRLAW